MDHVAEERASYTVVRRKAAAQMGIEPVVRMTQAQLQLQLQLQRGARMVELLKQPQFHPVPVEQQVLAIFAGSSGSMDVLPVADVRRFESEFLTFMADKYPEVAEGIRLSGAMSDDTQNTLKKAIADFKATFKPSM